MKIEGEGKLLRIFVGESDRWHGKPLYQAIVERVRKEGLAGATVIRGIEGFGADSRLHTARILPVLDEMVGEGMVTVERVEVIAYRGSAEPPA